MTNILNILCIILLLTFSFQTFAIDKDEFTDIQTVSEYFKRLCPPQTCIIIGVGRSPTPFIAYLSSEADNYVWTVPLSSFRYGEAKHQALSPELQEKLFTHFSHYLPSKEELKNRSVLVVDHCIHGDSLVSSKKYIESYFKSYNPHVVVQMAATIPSLYFEMKTFHPEITHLAVLSRSESNLALFLGLQRYDKRAPFGSFELENDISDKKENREEYTRFSAEIAEAKKQFSGVPKLGSSIQFFNGNPLLNIPYHDLKIEEKLQLCSSLVRLGPSERLGLHLKLLRDDDFSVRKHACSALDYYDTSSEKSLYDLALEDEFLHLCLARALPRYHGNRNEQIGFYKKLIQDPDHSVRSTLLEYFYKEHLNPWNKPIDIVLFASLAMDSPYTDTKKAAIRIVSELLKEKNPINTGKFFEKVMSEENLDFHTDALEIVHHGTLENLTFLSFSMIEKVRTLAEAEINNRAKLLKYLLN